MPWYFLTAGPVVLLELQLGSYPAAPQLCALQQHMSGGDKLEEEKNKKGSGR